MVRSAHPALLGFRHYEFAEDTMAQYKLIYGQSALKNKTCMDDVAFMMGYNNGEQRRLGMGLTDCSLIWLASGLEEQHDATLIHELLHAYLYLWNFEEIIHPEELEDIIEEETVYILEDEPSLVEMIKTYYRCDRRKYR